MPTLDPDTVTIVPISGQQPISPPTFDLGPNTGSAIGALPGGGYVVAWAAYQQDGSAYGIYAQRFSGDGSKLGDVARVNTTTADHQFDPVIATFPDGGYVIAWGSNAEFSSDQDVYFQRYAADGTPAGGETLVNTTTAGRQNGATITTLEDGGFVVAWTTASEIGVDGDVYLQRYAPDGAPVGGETLVNTTTDDVQWYPRIAALDDGGYVVTWTSFGQDGSGTGVYARRYAADGSPAGDEFLVNATTEGSQYDSVITPLADGGFAIAWRGGEGALPDMHVRLFDADGTPRGGETIVAEGVEDGGRILLQGLADGGFAASWAASAEPGGVMLVRLFDASGAPASQAVPAGDSGLQATTGDLVELADGTVLLVLSRAKSLNFTDSADIEQQRIAFSAARQSDVLGSGIELVQGTAGDDRFHADGAALNPGDIIAGEGGHDVLEISGDADIREVRLYDIEAIHLGAGDDSLVLTPDQFGRLSELDGGAGFDSLVLAGVADLRSVPLANFERIAFEAGSAGLVQVNGFAEARLIEGGDSRIVLASDEALDAAQRAAVFANGVDAVLQDGANYFADGTVLTVGEARAVNTTLQGHQQGARSAILADGGYVVTWMSSEMNLPTGHLYDLDYDILAQRYAADGTPVGGETRINTGSDTVDHYGPGIAALNDGGYVIVWSSNEPGEVREVFAQRFDAGGQRVGDEIVVNSTTEGLQGNGQVAGLADGGFLVVWTAALPDGGGFGIFSQRFGADGSRTGEETFLGPVQAAYLPEIQIDTLGDGSHVISWSFEGDVHAYRFGADGGAIGGEQVLIETAQTTPISYEIAALADGSYVVGWSDTGAAGTDLDVYFQRYAADGGKLGEAALVNTTTAFDQSRPTMTALSDGGFAIGWKGGAGVGGVGYYLQLFAADGSPRGSETFISESYYLAASGLALSELPDGNLLATWEGVDAIETAVIVIDEDPATDIPSATSFRMLAAQGFVGGIGGYGEIIGTGESEDIRILDQAGHISFGVSFNRGNDVIRLPGEADGWSIKAAGSYAILSDGDTFATIPLGTAGTALAFDDGIRFLRHDPDAATVLIGDQAFGGGDFMPITAGSQGEVPAPAEPGDPFSRLVLASGGSATIAGTTNVNGTAAGAETLEIIAGSIVLDPSFNRGGDMIRLDDPASDFTAVRSGSSIVLEGSDTDLFIPVGPDGATLAFGDDDLRIVRFDPETMEFMIGEQIITGTAVGLIA